MTAPFGFIFISPSLYIYIYPYLIFPLAIGIIYTLYSVLCTYIHKVPDRQLLPPCSHGSLDETTLMACLSTWIGISSISLTV